MYKEYPSVQKKYMNYMNYAGNGKDLGQEDFPVEKLLISRPQISLPSLQNLLLVLTT